MPVLADNHEKLGDDQARTLFSAWEPQALQMLRLQMAGLQSCGPGTSVALNTKFGSVCYSSITKPICTYWYLLSLHVEFVALVCLL